MPDPADLERCGYCDAWFNAASLDEVILHGFGSCLTPDPATPNSGIRGEKVSEPPQG